MKRTSSAASTVVVDAASRSSQLLKLRLGDELWSALKGSLQALPALRREDAGSVATQDRLAVEQSLCRLNAADAGSLELDNPLVVASSPNHNCLLKGVHEGKRGCVVPAATQKVNPSVLVTLLLTAIHRAFFLLLAKLRLRRGL